MLICQLRYAYCDRVQRNLKDVNFYVWPIATSLKVWFPKVFSIQYCSWCFRNYRLIWFMTNLAIESNQTTTKLQFYVVTDVSISAIH